MLFEILKGSFAKGRPREKDIHWAMHLNLLIISWKL